MSIEQYLKLLDTAYKAHDEFKKEKGDWGKETHAKVEDAIKESVEPVSQRPVEVALTACEP